MALISPPWRAWPRARILPTPDRRRLTCVQPSSGVKRQPSPWLLKLKPEKHTNDLKRGKPGVWPALMRLKKAAKALSKRRSVICGWSSWERRPTRASHDAAPSDSCTGRRRNWLSRYQSITWFAKPSTIWIRPADSVIQSVANGAGQGAAHTHIQQPHCPVVARTKQIRTQTTETARHRSCELLAVHTYFMPLRLACHIGRRLQ